MQESKNAEQRDATRTQRRPQETLPGTAIVALTAVVLVSAVVVITSLGVLV
ncbi:hypothetical protein AA0Z99_00270 [Agrococcus sp. 1P02AA]|uniref:hypothetical protein n=1 Tax=Agrococcus sp. 1P02AA TaxID=3132259 RepID=UPI0039A5AA40